MPAAVAAVRVVAEVVEAAALVVIRAPCSTAAPALLARPPLVVVAVVEALPPDRRSIRRSIQLRGQSPRESGCMPSTLQRASATETGSPETRIVTRRMAGCRR